jgi:hypothetical protein
VASRVAPRSRSHAPKKGELVDPRVGRSGFSSRLIALSGARVPQKHASGEVIGCRARGHRGGQIPASWALACIVAAF